MKKKSVDIAMLLFLLIVFVLLMVYYSDIAYVNLVFMPIIFCASKLMERLGITLYHSSFETDAIGLTVLIGVLLLLLVYDWNRITLWFFYGTLLTLAGVILCREQYKTMK